MRRGLIAAAAVVAAVVLSPAPASADDTVVVRGLAFPDGLTSLSITGCAGLFDTVAEPVTTYLSHTPGAPAGQRSLKYDLAGGNAVGSQHAVASLAATTTAGLSVFAPNGATGVAYVGYRAPADWATSLVWVGRATLAAAPGGWQPVDATGLSYTWTQYDLATRQPVVATAETTTVAAFLAAHGGDGPGFYTLGFGCDGAPFKIDALRVGSPGAVTTYDLEGFTSTTAIGGSPGTVTAGEPVTLTGAVRDGRGLPLPHGLLVLEAREPDAAEFTRVAGVVATLGAGDPSVTLTPSRTMIYRWRFVGTWSVEGSLSPTFTIDVRPGPGPGPASTPDPGPTNPPTPPGPATPAPPAPAGDATSTPAEDPTPTPAGDPTPTPAGDPTASGSPQ